MSSCRFASRFHSPIKVVPEILSALLTSIVRYLLITNSDTRDAITWFRKNRLMILYEVTLAMLQQANVDILIDHTYRMQLSHSLDACRYS
jgi:phage gp36-like protein